MTNSLNFFGIILVSFVVFTKGFSTSAQDPNQVQQNSDFESQKNTNDVADALYQIAQILRNNQNHSNLYERLAILEASVTLSQSQNVLAETRLKELENQIQAMNNQLKLSFEVLEKAESLEINTKTLMENFEEKLSTLATEILRLKSVAVNIEESLLPSGGQRTNFLQEDTREVESDNQSQTPSLIDEKNYMQNLTSKSIYEGFVDLREICFVQTPRPTSASFSEVEEELIEAGEKCWFTFEGKFENWTTAEQFCRQRNGNLVSPFNNRFTFINLTKENEQIFWISKMSTRNSSNKSEIPTEKHFYLQKNSKSDFGSSEIDRGNHDFDLGKKSSGVVDIRNLPNLEERNENIEKNIYISNVRIVHDDGFVSSVDAFSGKRVSKRSPEDSVSLTVPQDAVNFNDFLLLQSNKEVQEENFELQQIMSDGNSGSPPDLLSLIRGMTNNYSVSKSSVVSDDNTNNCPMMICTKDAECVVREDDCSNKKAFWCQR